MSWNSFKVELDSERMLVRLEGELNEDFPFSEIVIPEGVTTVHIDLEGIVGLNSSGLRAWTAWTDNLCDESTNFFLLNCPEPMVDQFMILEGALPRHTILNSLFIPYACSACGQKNRHLMERNRDFFIATPDSPAEIRIPSLIPCDKCGGEMKHAYASSEGFFKMFQRHKEIELDEDPFATC